MKRWLIALAGLAAVGLAAAALTGRGHAQGQYPSIPGVTGAPATSPQQPYLPTSPPGTPGVMGGQAPAARGVPEHWRQAEIDPDINRDILITPAQGPFVIFVTRYTDPEAPLKARQLVEELRGEKYRLPAFVFTYGVKERQEEQERVRRLVEERKAALEQQGLVNAMPIRVPRRHIPIEVAVVVGGYRDRDTARRDLDRIRKLPALDPKRVTLPMMYLPKDNGASGQIGVLNPFVQAFVAQNPTAPHQQTSERDKVDYSVLKRLNAGEAYSLLKCPKPWTLAVKLYPTPTAVQHRGNEGGFWKNLTGGGKASAETDIALHNARSLTELLRKGGWQAYVLHTPFYSLVTVGGYDSMQDPRILGDQQELAKLNSKLDPRIQLSSQPSPIPVPVAR
jgi:hypothetical protein